MGAKSQISYLWNAASNDSDKIQTKVIVTKRRRYGDSMDAEFRMVFSSVPRGKEYEMCAWHGPPEMTGEKPACVSGTFTPGPEGEIYANFNSRQMVQGEWIQITIRSIDGTVQKSARFTPFK